MKLHQLIFLSLILAMASFSAAIEVTSNESVVSEPVERMTSRIINGLPASPNEYDFFVALMSKYPWQTGHHFNPFCGGSYIGDQLVVTAAHCVDDLPTSGIIYLLIGNHSTEMASEYCTDAGVVPYNCTYDGPGINLTNYHSTGWTVYTGLESNLISVAASDIKIHPLYANLTNDIAIINFQGTVTNSPVLLPTSDTFEALAISGAQSSVTVIGHGDTVSDLDSNTFISSPQLMEVALTPRTDAVCSSFYGSNFKAGAMVCAGDPGLDSCQGDSGGPLIDPTTNTLLGVVSWGPQQCADPVYPYGVYTNVYNYKSYIESGGSRASGTSFINASGKTQRLGNEAGSLSIFFILLTSLFGFRRSVCKK